MAVQVHREHAGSGDAQGVLQGWRVPAKLFAKKGLAEVGGIEVRRAELGLGLRKLIAQSKQQHRLQHASRKYACTTQQRAADQIMGCTRRGQCSRRHNEKDAALLADPSSRRTDAVRQAVQHGPDQRGRKQQHSAVAANGTDKRGESDAYRGGDHGSGTAKQRLLKRAEANGLGTAGHENAGAGISQRHPEDEGQRYAWKAEHRMKRFRGAPLEGAELLPQFVHGRQLRGDRIALEYRFEKLLCG